MVNPTSATPAAKQKAKEILSQALMQATCK